MKQHAAAVCRLTTTALVAAALALGSAGNSLAQTPTPAQQRLFQSLGQEMIDKLQATGKFTTIKRVGADELVARTHDGAEASVNLANIAADIAARPGERPRLVDQLLRIVMSSVEPKRADVSKDAFVESLRIIVRHADYLKPAKGAKPTNPIHKSIAGDAVAFVATTSGEEISLLMAGDGAKFELADDALREAALAQMQRYVTKHTTEDSGQVRVFLAEDESYSPSLLLLTDLWAKVERDFGPDFLVAIPDRTVLLAAPLRNAAGLTRTVDALMQQRKAKPLIAHFIQRADGGWKQFK